MRFAEEYTMTDRIVNSAWWLALMTMICAASGMALFVGYRGLFELLAARWTGGALCLAISVGAAIAAFQLCRHRNDLL